jgi:predicted phosphodiesterase
LKKRIFVVTDIHGRLSALNEVLDAAGFDNSRDWLITLGDECDGGSKTKEVIDRILEVENRIDVQGNHDYYWFRPWAMWDRDGGEFRPPETAHWETQGGIWTEKSYGFNPHNVPQEHKDYLNAKIPYYIDKKKNAFVHGGFRQNVALSKQEPKSIAWDRKLLKYAQNSRVRGYNYVFVGHTSTQFHKKKSVHITDEGQEYVAYTPCTEPVKFNNLIMCDCGAGYTGRLALVNVEHPGEYWLSQFQVPNYEPEEVERYRIDDDGSDDTEEFVWGTGFKDKFVDRMA